MMDPKAYSSMRRAVGRSKRLAEALLSGQPLPDAPRGRAMAHVRCSVCGVTVVTVEDHEGLLCWRLGPLLWVLSRPEIACRDHGVLIPARAIDEGDWEDDEWIDLTERHDEAPRVVRASPR